MADQEGNGQAVTGSKQRTSIAGEIFELTAPYQAGHTINEREANVLNQVRMENIGNNWRASVKEALEARTNGDPSKFEQVKMDIAQADAEYEFGKVSIRQPADPYEREARAIAREAIKAQLAEDGRSIKDVDEERLEAAIAATAMQDDVQALAHERVDLRKKSKGVSIVGDLGASVGSEEQQAASS